MSQLTVKLSFGNDTRRFAFWLSLKVIFLSCSFLKKCGDTTAHIRCIFSWRLSSSLRFDINFNLNPRKLFCSRRFSVSFYYYFYFDHFSFTVARSYEAVARRVSDIFPNTELRYQDEDGDFVNVTCSEEFQEVRFFFSLTPNFHWIGLYRPFVWCRAKETIFCGSAVKNLDPLPRRWRSRRNRRRPSFQKRATSTRRRLPREPRKWRKRLTNLSGKLVSGSDLPPFSMVCNPKFDVSSF